jgi:hypothetical protein
MRGVVAGSLAALRASQRADKNMPIVSLTGPSAPLCWGRGFSRPRGAWLAPQMEQVQ